ncbi:MAG: hypothetical protein HGA86_04585, partial [Anaerolineaceae bacterium]|nr:hypothetical protein [Anaerolineaceae bacterium]
MKKRIFLVFTVIFSVLVLSACFDMTQEYTINPDGTGKFMFDQGISNSIAQMGGDTATLFSDLQKVDQEISANEGFKNVKSEQYTKDDMTRFKVTGEFLSLEALTTTFNSLNTGTPVTFKKLENGNYAYQQTISPSSLGTDSLGGSSSDPNSAEMLKSMFKDKFWTVRFTVPKIVNTNSARMDSGPHRELPHGCGAAKRTATYWRSTNTAALKAAARMTSGNRITA